jgi:hypothetical protein
MLNESSVSVIGRLSSFAGFLKKHCLTRIPHGCSVSRPCSCLSQF